LIIFVLRHADRQPAPDDDLTPAGQERAELLARMLTGSGISTAYHSGAVRARRTLEPLKQKLGDALTVEAIGSGDVQRTVAAVKSRSIGDIIDTVGPIIEGLSGESIGLIGPNEFDKLFVLFIDPTDKATLLRLRYGTAT
jgi:hypothetical protein